MPFVLQVHCLEQATVPGFIARLEHEYRLVLRGADPNYSIPETELSVPGKATVQAALVCDPTEPPSTGPLLEVELFVTSERIDVSLGTATINALYYLEQARDALAAADPASTGLSPRFALRLQTDDPPEQTEGRLAPQVQLSLGVSVRPPPTRLASTRAFLRDEHDPSVDTFTGEGPAPPVSKAAAPEGFYFDGLDSRINWARLRSTNVSRLERARDAKGVLSFLPDLLYGDVTECVDEAEGWEAAEDSRARLLVKPLQLAQLSTQYLLFCEDMLKKQTRTFHAALARKHKEAAREQRELANKEAMVARLRAEIKATDRLLRSYEDVHKACGPSCPPLPVPVSAMSPSRRAEEEEEVVVGRAGRRQPGRRRKAHQQEEAVVLEVGRQQRPLEVEVGRRGVGEEEEEEDVVLFEVGSPIGSSPVRSPAKASTTSAAAEEPGLFDRHDTLQREELYQAIVTNNNNMGEATGAERQAGEGRLRRSDKGGGGYDDTEHLEVEDLDL